MDTFHCKQCGLCCKTAEKTQFGMIVLDFEAQQLKEINPNLNLVPFMQVNGNTVAYKFNHKDCPFLVDNKCSIYSERPLLCRAFPVIRVGFFKDKEIIVSKICSEVNRLKTKEPKIYGDSYKACLLFEYWIQKVKKNTLKNKKTVADILSSNPEALIQERNSLRLVDGLVKNH